MVKIVVDSGCDLTAAMKQRAEFCLAVAPLTMQLGDKSFVDDENLDISNYIDEMGRCPHVPKTAAPSPESFLEKFKGEESVFAVTLSSKISGSYNCAMVAKQLYLDEIGSKFIHVFDSLSASIGETLVALKINELAKINISDNEIVANVNQFIQNMRTYFILDRYDTIVKTGRMNAFVAKIASFMAFKPICGSVEGNMAFIDKAKGYNKAILRLAEIIQRDCADLENRVLGISHVKALQKALELKEIISNKIKFKDIIIVEASGLCATYADREGIIIAL